MGQHGTPPLPEIIKTILDFQQPKTVKGMLNFYHCFVPKAAAIMQPLFASTKGKTKMVEWSQDIFTAFSAAKQVLAAATLLVHPHATSPASITVDASNKKVGGVLELLLEH